MTKQEKLVKKKDIYINPEQIVRDSMVRFLFKDTNNLLSVKDMNREHIDLILSEALRHEKFCNTLDTNRKVRRRPERLETLRNITGVHMFSESSTRTRTSFEVAMDNLGGRVMNFELPTSSRSKGESLRHTIEQVLDYSSGIRVVIIRDKSEEVVQKIGEYATPLNVPVINGGDGPKEHPTQTLVDLFTLKKELGRLQDFNIAIVGDVGHSRTSHSLIQALPMFPNITVTFVAPDMLQMSKEALQPLGLKYEMTTDLREALRADAIYMNRLQLERFKNPSERIRAVEEYKKFCLTPELLGSVKNSPIILHPRPITEGPGSEIPEIIDKLPKAKYRSQAKNGVPVRMALLEYMISPEF